MLGTMICLITAAHAEADAKHNFCTNGSFEELNAQEFPVGWGGFTSGRLGEEAFFGVSEDAHTGQHALWMKVNSKATVGINRAQHADSDYLLPILRGIARFWYKAIASGSEGSNLQLFIIAMKEGGRDEVERVGYAVPPEHVGDGQWHQGVVEFDFTNRADAHSIHVAPRVNEGGTAAPGEILFDSIEVTKIGPRLQIRSCGLAQPLLDINKPVPLNVALENVGDEMANSPTVEITLPAGVSADRQTVTLKDLAPDTSATARFQIQAERPLAEAISVNIKSGEITLTKPLFLTAVAQNELEQPAPLQLANEHVCMTFPKTSLGYGIFNLEQSQKDRRISTAFSTSFTRLAYRASDESIVRVPLFTDEVEIDKGEFDTTYTFRKRYVDVDSVTWDFEFIFHLRADQKWVEVEYRAQISSQRKLLAFYGPMLYVKTGQRGREHHRYDAIFPGLEYLEDDEQSSSTLDIAPPYHIRRVPHPNKITIPLMAISDSGASIITGMMWDALDKWDGEHDRPAAVFASPNWFEEMEGYDVMGLFVPSALPEWIADNQTEAHAPYLLTPDCMLTLKAQLFSISPTEVAHPIEHGRPASAEDIGHPTVGSKNIQKNASAVTAINYWIERYGLPEPLVPPRGDWKSELQFSLTAYMDTLWVADKQTWHNTLDWDPWGMRLNPEFAHQLWMGAHALPEVPQRAGYLQRASFAIDKLGLGLGGKLPFFVGHLNDIITHEKQRIIHTMTTQDDDGGWRFNPDHLNAVDTIHHQDYHLLGNPGDVEIGLCAQNAYEILRYVAMTGDEESLQAGLKALEFMKQFKIPRAAQVWEVPVHTPDVLAAAHATQAYLQAYKITQNTAYLDDAVRWAYTGLPFVYLWQLPNMPYMLYASIPVFGATWFTHSWFGVAVQWNGLDYAYALFELAEYDDSLPWAKIARGLTVSAMYQQETTEHFKGLYPDSYNMMDRSTSAWKLAPMQIIRNLFVLMDWPADVCTTIVRSDVGNVYVNSAFPVVNSALTSDALHCMFRYPAEMTGYVMIAGLAHPEAVLKNANPLSQVESLQSVSEGWRYNPESGSLILKLASPPAEIRIEIPHPTLRYVPQILPPATNIGWNFEHTTHTGGWMAVNHLMPLRVSNGQLSTNSTGHDPYMVNAPTKISAANYKSLNIRMRVSKGSMAEVFWATEEHHISEATKMSFRIIPDGAFHEYTIPVAQHPLWRGVITQLRLDPTNVAGAEIEIQKITGQ